ncbi:hypothetical protein ABZ092_06070 [Streptomyces bobili]|uniref:hypothetical protein n=1 Tax=Streptomyces bobili TaxID=67280 RepID=UPI0033A2A5BC
MSVVVVALVAGALFWLSLPGEADPHDYLREQDDVVRGDGSLATVLAHYGVSLPDQVADVRFHDEESLIGSEGTLFLHFKVSDVGLTSFLQTLDVGSLTPGLSAGMRAGKGSVSAGASRAVPCGERRDQPREPSPLPSLSPGWAMSTPST